MLTDIADLGFPDPRPAGGGFTGAELPKGRAAPPGSPWWWWNPVLSGLGERLGERQPDHRCAGFLGPQSPSLKQLDDLGSDDLGKNRVQRSLLITHRHRVPGRFC
jgi:hypothetical protein